MANRASGARLVWIQAPSSLADWFRLDELPSELATTIGQIVPAGFERIVRILHPLRLARYRSVRWSDVASARGVPLRADARPRSLFADDPPSRAIAEQMCAGLGEEAWRSLGETLQANTSAGRVVYGHWEGYGAGTGAVGCTLLEHPLARHYISVGTFEDWTGPIATEFGVSLAWPMDRSWFLLNHFAYCSMYLACSDAMSSAVQQNPDLESVVASYDHAPS